MMMNTLRLSILISLLCAFSVPALPLAMGYTPEQLQHQHWPAGLNELLKSQEWTAAYWCNSYEYFYYKGDTKAFNRFLERYSQIGVPKLTLLLHSGKGYGVKATGDRVEADWAVTGQGWSPSYISSDFSDRNSYTLQSNDLDPYDLRKEKQPVATLELWIGGHVDISEVVVPANVRVENTCGVRINRLSSGDTTVKVGKKEPEIKDVQCLQETVKLTQTLNEAKLGQIALFVNSISQGQSQFLIGQGSSGNPKTGHTEKPLPLGDVPLITAYRLTSPVATELSSIGQRVLIGAVILMVPATSPLDANSTEYGLIRSAKSGVYLLAYNETDPDTVDLIHLSVDNIGNPVLSKALTVPAVHFARSDHFYGKDWYGVSVQFPPKDQVSVANPANRATVLMALSESDGVYRNYQFHLDLQIEMR